MEFLPTVIFFATKKKKRHHQHWVFFQAELFFFITFLSIQLQLYFSFDKCCAFVSDWCLLSECYHSRDLPLDLLSISAISVPAATVARDLYPGWKRGWGKEGGGKHCWQAHTGHSWQGTARCWEYLSRSHWWIVGDWRHTSGCCIRVYVFY